jgi:fatty aldehyde-generating acyl-ACP reductase
MIQKFALLVHSDRWDTRLQAREFKHGLPAWLADGFSRLTPPKKVSDILRINSPYGRAEGLFLSISLSVDQAARFPGGLVSKKICRAGKVAEKMGVRIIGLGALNSAADNVGAALARTLNVPVTTGKSYVTAAALEGSRKALELLGVALDDADVLILGAADSPGSTCARLLARDGVNYLTLVASDQHRLEALARLIFYEYGVSCKVTSQIKRSAGRADLILSAGGKSEQPLNVEDVKAGSVVYDLAGTLKIPTSPARKRSDVLFIEGCTIEIPGSITGNIDYDIPTHIVPASLVETMVLALEGRFENYTLGRELRIGKVEEIGRLAAKHGFKLAGFCSRGLEIAGTDVIKIKHQLLDKKTPVKQAVRTGGIR